MKVFLHLMVGGDWTEWLLDIAAVSDIFAALGRRPLKGIGDDSADILIVVDWECFMARAKIKDLPFLSIPHPQSYFPFVFCCC